MTDTVLRTKLYVPPLRSSYVPRPQLIAKLNAGLDSRITLFSAPAGYGKTTLVAEWFHSLPTGIFPGEERQGVGVTWLSLDENDNDPARFMAYLIAALDQLQDGIGETAKTLLQSPQAPPPEVALTALINDIASIPSPLILALDDYHVIQALPIHQQLGFLVEHQPPQMHLVILTREDPPLPLARLRALGQMVEIRQDALRFSAEECADFLQRVMGLKLTKGEITALERRTEGWIAGLQLAALSMQGRKDSKNFIQAFTGSSRYVLDYLIEEIYDRQSSELQSFLLKTSILDRLSGSLCDAVVERSGSQEVIETLEKANLFVVPLDQSRTWYRYHRLFAELLRNRLQSTKGISQAQLHQKASRWFKEKGYLSDAMRHALAAHAWDDIKGMISTATAQAIKDGHLATLGRWSSALPNKVVKSDYRLATFKGWACLIAGQYQETLAYTDLADSLFPRDAPAPERSVLFTLRSYLTLAKNDIPSTVQWASKAIEICRDSDPYGLMGGALANLAQAQLLSGNFESAIQAFRELVHIGQETGHMLTTVSAMANLAQILNTQGKRREALSYGKRALELCTDPQGRALPLSEFGQMIMGMLYVESNELEQAHQCWSQALELSQKHGQSTLALSSMLELGRLQQMLGEEEAAFATIQEARQYASKFNFPTLLAQIAGYEADLYLKSNNLAEVERWAETTKLSPEVIPNHHQEKEYLIYARLLLKLQRLDEVERLLANLERFAELGGRVRTLITVYILQALTHQTLGHQEQAITLIEKALNLAAPEGYVRAFLDEDPSLVNLLTEARPTIPSFVDTVMAAMTSVEEEKKPLKEVVSPQKLVEPLSEREVEVLKLVAAGLSNRAIAERLIITVGTVKTHLHNIYGKMGVRGRTEAIARARELELL